MPPTTDRARAALCLVLPGALAGLIGAWAMTVPSLWRDESVSWFFATEPFTDSWRLWGEVDAVHAAYDVLLRPFTGIEPIELALRLPSLAGFVIATVGIVLLGRRLSGWSLGVCAGCVYAVLPVTSRYAQEGRSYALVSAAAVLATLALLRTCERPGRARLAWYVLAVGALGYLHLYALLMLLPHGLHVLLVARDALRRVALAWIAAGVLLLPLVLVAAGQRERQLFWLTPPELEDLRNLVVLVGGGSAPAVVALGAAIVAGTWWMRDRPIAVLWAVVPVVVSFAVSQVYPIFTDRYVLFVVPAVALLAGAGIDGAARLLTSRSGVVTARVVGIVVIAGLALPTQQEIRRPDSRQDDLRTMSRELSAAQRPGDRVMPVPARAVKFMNAYGEPFDGARLVRPGEPPRRNVTRIWVVTIGYPSVDRHPELADLDLMFCRTSVHSYGTMRVSLWLHRPQAQCSTA